MQKMEETRRMERHTLFPLPRPRNYCSGLPRRRVEAETKETGLLKDGVRTERETVLG